MKFLRLAEVLDAFKNHELVRSEKSFVVTGMVRVNIIGSEPWVLEALLSGDSESRVFLKHFADEILGACGDSVPVCGVESEWLLQNIAENFLVIVSFEGRVTAQENEENDSKTPDITRDVIVALKDFRSNIVWSSNDSGHALNFSFLRETF